MLELGVYGYFVPVFISKFLVSVTFASIATLAPALVRKIRNIRKSAKSETTAEL